jgi:hypothetical protein
MLQDIRRASRRELQLIRQLFLHAALPVLGCVYAMSCASVLAAPEKNSTATEQWDVFEVELPGSSSGNPFLDVQLSGKFELDGNAQTVAGFYDGDGVYRIRFMPNKLGRWKYTTESNVPELAGKSGEFEAVAPTEGNHGPVRVKDTFHFGYEDGSPYRQLGTTCYVWNHQGDALEEQTLATLAESPFNKIRRTSRRCIRSRAHRPTSGITRDSIRRFFNTSSSVWHNCATWASRPTSFFCIRTMGGNGASIGCRTKSTTAT